MCTNTFGVVKIQACILLPAVKITGILLQALRLDVI